MRFVGLRETKKRQTRTAIADAALELFLEHGFDRVTVAEVARHAGVSTNTVFNYFPAKEDLFFDREAEVEQRLATLVRGRPATACPVETVRDDLLSALARDEPTLGLRRGADRFWRVVLDSPALRAREREIGEHAEAALAAALADHPPLTPYGPPLPGLLAGALAGTYRAVLREIRDRMLSGEDPAQVRDAVTPEAVRAFDALCRGLHPVPG
ncbi:TetR family transcriptional regulator [Streptomyces sp. SID4982]|nr:TetR family transcriptional regulator [Streptomyces sp. SID4982]